MIVCRIIALLGGAAVCCPFVRRSSATIGRGDTGTMNTGPGEQGIGANKGGENGQLHRGGQGNLSRSPIRPPNIQLCRMTSTSLRRVLYTRPARSSPRAHQQSRRAL